MAKDEEKEVMDLRRSVCFSALLGMVFSLLDPPSLADFLQAHKAIFSKDSPELEALSKLLNVEKETLRRQIYSFLEANGFPCDAYIIH